MQNARQGVLAGVCKILWRVWFIGCCSFLALVGVELADGSGEVRGDGGEVCSDAAGRGALGRGVGEGAGAGVELAG